MNLMQCAICSGGRHTPPELEPWEVVMVWTVLTLLALGFWRLVWWLLS